VAVTDLSPHAQAVCDAYCKEADNPYYFERSGLVAALRAAAEHVVPKMTTPWNSTLTPIISAGEVRAKFLAIADELECSHD
jgi:hypothetical protein